MSMHSTSAPLRGRRLPVIQVGLLVLAAGVAALVFAALLSRERDGDAAVTTPVPQPTAVQATVHPSAPQPVVVYLTDTAEEAAEFEQFVARVTSETGGEPSPVEVLVLPASSAEEALAARRTIGLLELDAGAGRVRVVDLRRRPEAAPEPDVQTVPAVGPDAR